MTLGKDIEQGYSFHVAFVRGGSSNVPEQG
jgi:hypothetical protein